MLVVMQCRVIITGRPSGCSVWRANRWGKRELSSMAKWVCRNRGALIVPLLVFSALCFYGEAENDWLIWGLGMSIILAGFFLRVWAQQHIQRRLGFAKHLTTTGPYAFVRNPLYIGNMLLLVGATVLSELLWLVPLGHPTSVCLRQS